MNVMVSAHPYWVPVYQGFKQAAEALGCRTVFSGTPDYDITKQIASFEQDLVKKPAGVLLHPMQSDPFIEPINRAIDQGTAVVTFAADSPNSKRVSYITSDNVAEGTYAADAVAKAMDGKGEYAVLENPGQDNHDKRIAAFIARMEAKWPDMKLVGRAASNQDPTKAYQAVLSLAQANPNLGAVFMPEANSAIGAAQAANEGGGKIKVMLADVNAKILDMIKAGEIFGSVNPNQGMQGYMGFMLLWLAKHPDLIDPMNDAKRSGFNGMSVPFVDNGFSIVTAENADDFYWDKYLKRRGTKGIEE
jgi:ribose transport system substrate-binding protein